MKTKQQLLQEQKQLRTKLAQVTKQINLQEVSRMQQIAGVKSKRFLKENFEEGDSINNPIDITDNNDGWVTVNLDKVLKHLSPIFPNKINLIEEFVFDLNDADGAELENCTLEELKKEFENWLRDTGY
jgi:hypothetical protein